LKKGEQTRQDLLAAARAVFARDGYAGAETGRIAREARKSIGVFYIYFENKDDALRTLVEEFRTELHESIARPLNAPEEIGSVLETLWSVYKRHAATFVALIDAAAGNSEFAEIARTLREYAKADFSNMARQRLGSGLPADLDPRFAGEALETMVNYCLYEWLARGVAHLDDARERLALDALVTMARGALRLDAPVASNSVTEV
jgi:AcrR family transcriptional regulator